MDDLEQKDPSEDTGTSAHPGDSDADELDEDDLENVAGGIVWKPEDDSKWERRW